MSPPSEGGGSKQAPIFPWIWGGSWQGSLAIVFRQSMRKPSASSSAFTLLYLGVPPTPFVVLALKHSSSLAHPCLSGSHLVHIQTLACTCSGLTASPGPRPQHLLPRDKTNRHLISRLLLTHVGVKSEPPFTFHFPGTFPVCSDLLLMLSGPVCSDPCCFCNLSHHILCSQGSASHGGRLSGSLLYSSVTIITPMLRVAFSLGIPEAASSSVRPC